MTLFKIEWRNQQKALMIWLSTFLGLLLIFSAIYPQMFTPVLKQSMEKMMASLPDSLLGTFNIALSGPASMMTPVGYFAYYFQYLYLAACIYAMLLGSQGLIREESDGTIDFLYAQPITRWQIVLGKFLVALIQLAFFWFVNAFATTAFLWFFKEKNDATSEIIHGVRVIYYGEFFSLFFFLCLGLFFSTFLKNVKQSTGITLSVVFGFYLMGILANLFDKLHFLREISPLSQGIPANLLVDGLPNQWWILLVSLLLLGLSFFFYQRKDFHN